MLPDGLFLRFFRLGMRLYSTGTCTQKAAAYSPAPVSFDLLTYKGPSLEQTVNCMLC